MGMRAVRAVSAAALLASGALVYAGSWQRWADSCWWGEGRTPGCLRIQDHRHDFWIPTDPWTPVGSAAQLAGLSLLVFALAAALLPWALTGRRPGAVSAVTLALCVPAIILLGWANLRSGRSGQVVDVPMHTPAVWLWGLVLPILMARLAWAARGWARAAAIVLVLAMPVPGMFFYGFGPYDAFPWYEGVSGILQATAGLCLLAAAARRPRPAVGWSAGVAVVATT